MKNIKKLCKQALMIILVCLILSNSTLAFALDLSTTISDVQMEANARIGYSLLSTGITDEIDSDRPVIVFGNLSASPSTATGNHAVVVYGYYETSTGFTYDIAHFGWSGYGEAYVYGTYGGSTTFRPL